MIPLYNDPHFTFRFAADRIIPRFHLESIGAGRRVSVFKFDPTTGHWNPNVIQFWTRPRAGNRP